MRISSILIPGLCFLICACNHSSNENRVVVIQPFADIDPALTSRTFQHIKLLFAATELRKPIELPKSAYYAPRRRYRADELIRFLKPGASDTVVIGLTSNDISTTKNGKKDWGIMGLAFCPGNSCVVSTFRLTKSNLPEQFYKVAIHELGHTQGLPHCPDKRCFMRDAEGGNPLDEEVDFCVDCKAFLTAKGWVFQ